MTIAAPAAHPAGRRSACAAAGGEARRPRSARTLVAFGLLALLATAALTSLGIWQVERRAWKLDLIARVDSRVHAAPSPAPGPGAWPEVDAEHDAYRHVRVGGHFLPGRDTLVQAVTAEGGGYWVLTPFQAKEGFVVFVNRGFVPSDGAKDIPPSRATSVTGLLRLTEPGGAFLRHNDPAAGRWYSRDVAAIAKRSGFTGAAPYFIDAEASAGAPGSPVGGLTVIAFPNNHLVYALTWFGLALMTVGWSVFLVRDERHLRRGLGAGGMPAQNGPSMQHAAQGPHADP